MKRLILFIFCIFIFLLTGCEKTTDGKSISSNTSSQISISENNASSVSSENSISISVSSISGSSKKESSGISSLSSDEIILILINKKNNIPDNFPLDLKTISKPYNSTDKQVHLLMYDNLANMLKKAIADGVHIKIQSAYRSIQLQEDNFNYYVQKRVDQGYTYDKAVMEVSTFCAKPGQSEHNSGLAIDINVEDKTDLIESFDNTAEFKWMAENAKDFGFILRYPKNKADITGYKYEPWHYRYVGIENAKKINEAGQCLEEYLS